MKAQALDPHLVRASPIAGAWYPGTPRELEETVDVLLAHAEYLPTDDRLVGLIAPHAGFPYSGQTAAYAYRQLTGRQFDLVVLLGPSHYQDYGFIAISAKKYYATPLGAVELDQDWIQQLANRVALTRVEHDTEHSLEIQLPFLQRVLGQFKLVPIMMSLPLYLIGPDAFAPCQQLADVLADLAKGKRVLLVASSDLSHLQDYEAVREFDARTAELVEALDVPGLVKYMSEGQECRACGDTPILTLLLTAQALGASRAQVLYRTNSADVTGRRAHGQYTVGYMAVGVYRRQT